MPLTLPTAQAISSGLNAGANIASTILTNRANMKLAQYGYEQERQMIAEQNAYNSPVEQMKRYQEAGLNPNLIYGNGVSSAGNQQSIAHYNAPSLDAPHIDLSSVITSMLQAKKEMTAIENMDKQNYLIDQQGYKAHQDYLSSVMDNAFKAEILGFNPGLILSPEESQKIREGNMFKKYSAEVNQAVTEDELKKLQKSFQSLSYQEKKYFIDNIQKWEAKYKEFLAKYQEEHYKIEEVDAKFEQQLMQWGLSGKGASIGVQLLKALLK